MNKLIRLIKQKRMTSTRIYANEYNKIRIGKTYNTTFQIWKRVSHFGILISTTCYDFPNLYILPLGVLSFWTL